MAAKVFYRTFKNMDVCGLCRVWNQSWYAKGKDETIHHVQFNKFVTSKLLFEPDHLVVAVERLEEPDSDGLFDGRIVGFVHGGFAPNKERNGCDKSAGYIAMLVAEPREDQQEILVRLLYEMEKIFFQMGIRTIYAGAVYPNAPFYTNDIFNSEQIGIAENDPFLPQILLRNQYIAAKRYRTLMFCLHNITPLNFTQRVLASNVDLVTPNKYSLRNSQPFGGPAAGNAQLPVKPIPRDWWEICARPDMEWNHFILRSRATQESIAWVGIRELPSEGEEKLLGLHDLYVRPDFRNMGYAKLLLTQVLNKLQIKFQSCQVKLMVPEDNIFALRTFSDLRFETTATGNVYRRELPVDFPETFQASRMSEIGMEFHA
ncbi:MAG: GNAT family N-acetyltransferase [Thermoguttaceae bacterium]|nr:GNAT family N-acetyltransferase [Thermoguttaceae bacterium]